MACMKDMNLATRHALPADQDDIVELSRRVQNMLTSTGSLQQIGPLELDTLAQAITSRQCFVLEQPLSSSHTAKVMGCALSKSLAAQYFLSTSEFNMESFQSPWHYLHSIMLEPDLQGRGVGKVFVAEVVNKIALMRSDGGTLFLDCWAGNDKLRKFYSDVGFTFAAIASEEDYEIAVFYRPLHAMNCQVRLDEGSGHQL